MVAVSIVIITYARQDLLRACLDTCTPQTSAIPGGFEIVVVDNNPAGTPRALGDEVAVPFPTPATPASTRPTARSSPSSTTTRPSRLTGWS